MPSDVLAVMLPAPSASDHRCRLSFQISGKCIGFARTGLVIATCGYASSQDSGKG
jgi:hypothetical protein